MLVLELEKKIKEIDEVVVIIRASENTIVGDYTYQRKAADNSSITDWLETRIRPLIGDHQLVVVDGKGQTGRHGRTKLETLRNTYEQ